MLFAAGQTLVYLVLFAIFYRGIEDENSTELLAYFAYVTLIVATILNVEVGYYHFVKFRETGALEFIRNDSEISLGFGDANLIAYNVGLLIPMQLYGFTKCRGRLVYLISALLTYVLCVSCVSRTATIAATLILGLGFLLSFFARGIKKSRRVTNRIWILLLIVAVGVVCIIYPAQLESLFADIDRTFNEQAPATMQSEIGQLLQDLFGKINLSGRIRIWDECGLAFEENPIFGRGIYFLEIPGSFELSYMPWIAHNTLMYLIGAGGIVALAAYLLYRLCTALVFFVRPSTDKWFLFLVCLYLVVSGITDNYVFYFFTAFPYVLALAIACKINRENKAQRLARRERVASKLAQGEIKN